MLWPPLYLQANSPAPPTMAPSKLRVELNVVGGEESRCSTVMTKPPVLIRKFEVGDLGAFGEAKFCTCPCQRDLPAWHQGRTETLGDLPLSSAAS